MESASSFPTPPLPNRCDRLAVPRKESVRLDRGSGGARFTGTFGLGLLKILTVRSLCGYFSLKTKYFKTPKAISIKVIQIFINVIINPWTIPIPQFAPPFAPPNSQCALNLDLE
jgi:hypothetical protein